MMTISLELPEGVAPPKMRGVLTGPPDDLRIEIRLADFVSALKDAQAAGATVQMVPHGVVIDKAPAADPPTPLPFKLAKKAAAKKVAARKHATEGQRRWNSGQEPLPVTEPGPYVPSEGTAPDLVLKALSKKPASSLELTELYPTVTSGSIYQAVKFLREKGLVEGFEDEVDGTKRWRLCK